MDYKERLRKMSDAFDIVYDALISCKSSEEGEESSEEIKNSDWAATMVATDIVEELYKEKKNVKQ